MIDKNNIPASIAIIMDGNGRWATNRMLPRVVGHNAGMKSMKKIIEAADDIGVKHLTVYAFSTENWKRSDTEVNGIFKLLVKYIDSDIQELSEKNVKVTIIGDRSRLSDKVNAKIDYALEKTEANTGMQFNIALNYGSRNEILRAVKTLGEEIASGKLSYENIDEDMISSKLYTGEFNIPDPDLVIRTSGEIRLSNFLMWQLAYSEMIFVDDLWPDFTPEKFYETIEEYQNRNRRFGGR